MMGNRSKLKNFVEKFIRTVRFGNDHFRAIMGYGDYVIGDSVISRQEVLPTIQNLKNKYGVHSFRHMDLCGPMRVQSINGKKYILVIVDDYSRFTWVKFLRSKDETPEFVINFLKQIQVLAYLHQKICFIQSDIKTQSSSGNVNLAKPNQVTQPPDHLRRWTKDHPLDNIVGNPSRPVSTRYSSVKAYEYGDVARIEAFGQIHCNAATKNMISTSWMSKCFSVYGDLQDKKSLSVS
ncbi:retrovirus-related pol polyprotein from transposon TNT 1-94 [Tanacetum coccineum]